MHVAFLGVRPRLLAHGHYHVADGTTVSLPHAAYMDRIWSLKCGGGETTSAASIGRR